MWEAIRANKRRSVVLIMTMALVLMGLGYAIGLYFAPQWSYVGVLVAVGIWFILWIIAVAGGDGVVLGSMHARRIEHDDYPVLFNVVEEMSIAAGLPKMPAIYLIDTDAPNAFAVGTEQKSVVAVTTGLLMQLNRDELQGVVAHEIGHVKNHDTRFMVLAGVMMGAIILLADVFVRGMFFSGAGRRRSRGRGGGQGQLVLLVIALAFAILAPILAQMLYFACSRRREYLADASAARFTRYPNGLASALEKISGPARKMQKVNRAVAPMFIVNPLKGAASVSLFSTHPPTEERVRILRSMGGASYADYEAAFSKAEGSQLLGGRTLAEAQPLPSREPSAEPEKDDMERAREAVDILHRTAGFLFLTCACGLKIKLPPGFKGKEIACPRCHANIPIPVAAAAVAGAAVLSKELGKELAAEEPAAPSEPAAEEASYTYKPGQWQSFRCTCDRTVNLSPGFKGNQVQCPGCGRTIRIDRA